MKTTDAGSHVSATCVLCGRPVPDTAYADNACAAEAAQKLRTIMDLAPEARQVGYGLTRANQEGASGKPGSRSPGNDDALDALSEVQGTLGTWLRHVAEERGSDTTVVAALPDEDPIVVIAERLLQHLEWLRHRAEVDEVFDDIGRCARRLQGLIDGPRAKKYLGPCGAELPHAVLCFDSPEYGHDVECECWCHDFGDSKVVATRTCEGDVYGPAGGKSGRCRTCGAEVDQGERRAWLDEQVRDKAFRAAHIADAYGINVKTIRSWAERGHLRQVGIDRSLRPVYLVGDVLDLARTAAIRRAENEAKRDRREPQRESENAA